MRTMRQPLALCTLSLAASIFAGNTSRALAQEAIPTPDEIHKTFEVAAGYSVNLFASEVRFPLHNPLAMAFDSEGRLWVAVSPTYPQYKPGVPPNDKILVLDDTDRDGVADRCTTFADGLLIPTGFAIDTDGVWVAQQPDLWFLQDTDGDGVADRKKVVLHGFGTEDSHHSLSAFTWAPDGSFSFNEGVFHHTQVETPYGPIRARDAAVFRFKPGSQRLTVLSHRYYNNPWGHAYDDWGQSILSDASDGEHYHLASVIMAFDYPEKSLSTPSFLRRGRPMAGNAIISSRQFPEEVQGTHVNNQCIGFHGVRWDRLLPNGSGWKTEPLPDLLRSPDYHFRPAGARVGGDGALYILDFCNPLIGHMQYSHRDPNRDHTHGRIWRVVAEGRPLLEPEPVRGSPPERLLQLLRAPENHTRHFARRELQNRAGSAVGVAIEAWLQAAGIDENERERRRVEALWVYQGRHLVKLDLLEQVLHAREPRARAAGLRVLRHWVEDGHVSAGVALPFLTQAADDLDPRVRLEAVVACGFLRTAKSAGVALLVTQQPMDRALEVALQQTIKVLAPFGEPVSQVGRHFRLMSLSPEDLARETLDERVAAVQRLRSDTGAEVRRTALDYLQRTWGGDALGVFVELLDRADQLETGVEALEKDLVELSDGQLSTALPRLTRLLSNGKQESTRCLAAAAVVRATQTLAVALDHANDPADVLRAVQKIKKQGTLDSVAAEVLTALRDSVDPTPAPKGRFLRVSLPRNGTLTLAEVQVFRDGDNLALRGTATHSKTAHGAGAPLAIDGNTDGAWGSGTSTHTPEGGATPWWEVDLGQIAAIDEIVIWNRTDADLGQRLDGFDVALLDEERVPAWSRKGVAAPEVSKRFTLGQNSAFRRAAVEAAAHLPGIRAEVFAEYARVRKGPDKELARVARELMNRVPVSQWPAGFDEFRQTSVDPQQFALGRRIYERDGVCQTCHQSNGAGVPQSFPPLRGSRWVLGDDDPLIRIVLHGLKGPLVVDGQSYSSSMEPLGAALDDAEIAAVLTFVRNYWGNSAPAITEERVAQIRAKYRSRDSQWTVAELEGASSDEIPSETPALLWWILALSAFMLGSVGVMLLLNLRSSKRHQPA